MAMDLASETDSAMDWVTETDSLMEKGLVMEKRLATATRRRRQHSELA
jgi:hypothetical protein